MFEHIKAGAGKACAVRNAICARGGVQSGARGARNQDSCDASCAESFLQPNGDQRIAKAREG